MGRPVKTIKSIDFDDVDQILQSLKQAGLDLFEHDWLSFDELFPFFRETANVRLKKRAKTTPSDPSPNRNSYLMYLALR